MSKHEPRQAITRKLESAQCEKADIRQAKRNRYIKRADWYGSYLCASLSVVALRLHEGDTIGAHSMADYVYDAAVDCAHFGRLALGEKD